MPYRGRSPESVVPEPYAVRVGFHDAYGLVTVEPGPVAGRRQYRSGKLNKK